MIHFKTRNHEHAHPRSAQFQISPRDDGRLETAGVGERERATVADSFVGVPIPVSVCAYVNTSVRCVCQCMSSRCIVSKHHHLTTACHPPRKTIYNAYSDLYAHKHPNNSTHIFRMPHILAHVTQYPRAQLKMTHMYTQNTPF